MGQVRYEARADRVGNKREYDRYGLRLAGKHGGCWGRSCEQHVRLQTDKLFCQCAHQIDVAAAPARVDPHIAAFGPAELSKMPREFREQRLTFWIGRGKIHEHADPPNLIGLLRARRERPSGRRAAEQRDEIAPSDHSITSSARRRIEVGSSTPIAFAVFRLTANSKFAVCSTGSSAGCAPRRIFAT